MTSAIHQFTARHQHQLQRQQWLQVDGVAHSRAQLQQRLAAEPAVTYAPSTQVPAPAADATKPQADPVTRLRALILAALTGRDLELGVPEGDEAPSETPAEVELPAGQAPAADAVDPLAGRRLALLTREWEQSQVSLSVALQLGDKAITGGFSVSLSRQEQWTQAVDLAAVSRFLDPLVLNFGGPLALSGQRTDFDLNADGSTDAIARFASDSYALVRDLNGSGRIDDGREVIGALSGNGFAELQTLDEDGNGLITAGDSVWHSLRLWRPGDPGAGISLAARQVQALGVHAVASPFSLTAGSGELLGQIRSTGFFVAGEAIRPAQQVDLAV